MRKISVLTIVIVLFGVISCKSQSETSKENNMFGLFKKSKPIENFWNWFQSNEKEIREFEKNPDRILSRVIDSARKIERGLAVEFEPPKDGIITVTISADGDRNIFQTVQNVVSQAPKISGWTFVAFRQRVPAQRVKGMILKSEDHELNPDKMKFFPIVSNDSLNIIVYISNLTEENYNQVAYGSLMLIDIILGEYDCVTKVHSYDFHPMPTSPDELKNLRPLLELANYVDNFYSSKDK